jgi:hypothetical protein
VLTFRQAQAMSRKVQGALGLSSLELEAWPTFDSRPARLLHLDLRGRFNHFELISKGLVLPALLKIAGLPALSAPAA